MKLEKDRILELLAGADTKWYQQHPSPSSRWSYREHLEFVADYIAKHYDKKPTRIKVRIKNEPAKVHRLL